MILDALCEEFAQFLPNGRFTLTQAERQQHARDQSSHPAHLPDIVIWPHTTAEVSQIMRLAHQHRIPVTAWGAGTSLEGNPIPLHGGIVLNFQQMNKIVAIHTQDFQVTVQPGIFYRNMNQRLAAEGLFFAPDPGANASIGGMLANNAAGSRTVRYGATRDNVLALEVVLANGDVIHTGARTVKQSAGYDLTHLFVGSEGTLGIITQATLKLVPIPAFVSAATAAFSSVKTAAQVVYEIMGAGLAPNALELLDETAVRVINTAPNMALTTAPNLFMEFSAASASALAETMRQVADICHEFGCLAYAAGLDPDSRIRLWQARHRLFEIHQHYFAGKSYLLTDVAVPISAYPALAAETADLLQELQLDGSIISHAGDGNLHTAIFFESSDQDAWNRTQLFNKKLVELAQAKDGTCTGEHGVGLGKIPYMAAEHGLAIHTMQQIKHALDPLNILNPGKVLPEG